jgi:hypothetical protein
MSGISHETLQTELQKLLGMIAESNNKLNSLTPRKTYGNPMLDTIADRQVWDNATSLHVDKEKYPLLWLVCAGRFHT